MEVLLIADEDRQNRDQIAEFFRETDYRVVAADSIDVVMKGVLRKDARVILLGTVFDNIPAGDLVPILKSCNRDLTIILISNDVSLPLMRKLRREGIFYHALKPVEKGDREEFIQAVKCAFSTAVH